MNLQKASGFNGFVTLFTILLNSPVKAQTNGLSLSLSLDTVEPIIGLIPKILADLQPLMQYPSNH